MAGARKEFETAVTLAPNNATYLYDLGRVYEGLGDRRAAAHTIAEGLKRVEHPTPGMYAELALAADAAGDTKSAQAALAQAAALAGGAETAALTRSQMLMRHGDSKGAEQGLRELLGREPENRQALVDLGMVLSSEHRYGEALAIYRRAASGVPHAPMLHYHIALLLHQLGRENEARDECAIAVAQAPGDPNARTLMAVIEHSGGEMR